MSLQDGYAEMDQATLKKAGKKLIRRIVGLVIGLVLIIATLITYFNSYDVVQGDHAAVAYNLSGGVEDKPYTQGWKWHSPTVNFIEYPISKETVNLVKSKDGKTPDESFPVNTADGKSVNVDVTYTYAFHEDKLPYIFTRFRRANAETINNTFIKQQLKGAIQAVTTQYSVTEVYGGEKRGDITGKVQKELTTRLEKEGIAVEDFTFQDIRPDESTLAMIQKIVDAKNQEEYLKQNNKNLQQEQLNKTLEADTAKKIAIVQSEQAAAQVKIAADAEASRVKIAAAGNAEAVTVAATAQAEANNKINASLTEKLLQKQMIDVMPGIKFPSVMSGGGGSILNIPQELLKGATAPVK